MRSAIRWMDNLLSGDTPTARSDLLTSFITLCGWAWQTVVLLRHGKKKGWLNREQVAGDDALEAVWDEVLVGKGSDRLKLVEKIRNKCFGHFDVYGANQFIERHRNGQDLPPFFETANSGKSLQSVYPWGYEAQGAHFCSHPYDEQELRVRVGETRKLAFAITDLLAHCLGKVLPREISR